MTRTQKIRYYLTATLLGAGWVPVLMIPETTRDWLKSGYFWHPKFSSMILASILVAYIMRKPILIAEKLSARILRGALVPFVGAFIYLTLIVIWMWINQFFYGGLTNPHDSLSLIMMGLVATALSFYVVIPYGIFCQYLLQWIVWRSQTQH